MNFRDRFSEMFITYPIAAYYATRRGWVEAWHADQNTISVSQFAETVRITRALKDFIADRLFEADPSEKKIYVDYLARWFRYGMFFKELDKARNLLERHAADTKLGINHQFERFAKPSFVYRKGAQTRHPMKQNLLREIKRVRELEKFFDLYDRRQDYSTDTENTRQRDERYAATGGVVVLHTSPALRVYEIITSEAERAFARGTDFYDLSDDGGRVRGVLQVERSDGSRYRINMPYSACNENLDQVSFERMLRDIPELVKIVSSVYVAQQADNSSISGQGFISAASRICSRDIFPEGYVSESFLDTYKRTVENINDAPKIRRLRQRTGNPLLFYLADDLLSLSRFKSDREKVSGIFVKQIFSLAISTGTLDEAHKIIPIISTVADWRKEIGASDILPLFEASHEAPRALANLFVAVAKVPDWRNGEEAVHLPRAIRYLVDTKNWAKLKTLLVTASQKDNKVSAMWRNIISQQERGNIRKHETDNEYKRHHIDILLNRLDALDKGDYKPYRLAETPMGPRGREIAKENEARIRAARKAKKMEIA